MYHRHRQLGIRYPDLFIYDSLTMEGAFALSYLLRHGAGDHHQAYAAMAVVLFLLQALMIVFGSGYADSVERGYLVELKKVVSHSTVLVMLSLTVVFAAKLQDKYSRMGYLLFWLFCMAGLFAERALWKWNARRHCREKQARLLLICDAGVLEKTICKLRQQSEEEYEIMGAISYDWPIEAPQIAGVPLVASRENAMEYIRTAVVDEIFLSITAPDEEKQILINRLLGMGITVHVDLAQNLDTLPNRMVQDLGGCSVLTTSLKTVRDSDLLLKRLMDILGSLVGLSFTGILFVIFAPIICLQSPGPVFCAQERVGRNGRHFRLYKFRSMYADAEQRKQELLTRNKCRGQMFKMDDDPRITPIGRFMRKWSIDEFPQFWNVLRGDMSLVGTRPPTVDEFEHYDYHHKSRLCAKPGLTGLWQVSGRSDITDFEQVVQLDNQYIANWSIRSDIKILARTVKVVLTGSGSM